MSSGKERRAAMERLIQSKITPAGGWTRESLAELGVAWPPMKGWKVRLLDQAERGNMPRGIRTPPPQQDRPTPARDDDAIEAIELLGIVAAEFESDPTSTACFDSRIVERVIALSRKVIAERPF